MAAWDYDELASLVDQEALADFRERALNPEHPVLRGSAQNPDIFFQLREACNPYYDNLPSVVEGVMEQVNAKIGTTYQLFNYYGAPDAETVMVAMGSVCDTAEESGGLPERQGGEGGPHQGAPVPSLRHRPLRGRHPPPPARTWWCWTAARSPALPASPCTWTWSPLWRALPSPPARWWAAATAWAARTPPPAACCPLSATPSPPSP